MRKIAVILNGISPKGLALSSLVNQKYDLYIAADGGYNFCIKNGIKLDYLVGDFDSSSKRNIPDKVKVIQFSADKDATDGQLAADIAIEAEADSVDIYGGGGKRTDHLLGNLNILYRLLKSNIAVKMINNNEVIYMIKDALDLSQTIDKSILSLIPFTDRAIVSIKGVKYPLTNQKLLKDNTLGISNRAEGKVSIRVSSGYILVIVNSLKHLF